MRISIVVLISGSGSNLQAIIDQCSSGAINASISAVISNRPGCFGLQRAREANISATTIDHTLFATREAFDRALAASINSIQPDLIILAGFMRILSAEFVAQFEGKLLNIHPSLLPKYPGLNTHQRAIDAGDDVAGATVHFVTAELDGGPGIVQAEVAIQPNDSAEQLAANVLKQEHVIYPLAIKWFAENRLRLENGKAVFNDRQLPVGGLVYRDHCDAG